MSVSDTVQVLGAVTGLIGALTLLLRELRALRRPPSKTARAPQPDELQKSSILHRIR